MGMQGLMLTNENIICISSIDWDFVWQGHQEIMSTFAKNGNRVLFVENTGIRKPTFKDVARLKKRFSSWLKSVKGFRKESDNLFIYSPIVLPFPYSKVASWINRRLMIEPLKRWMRAMSFREPIIWTFLPTSIALDIIAEIDDRKLLVYYDIADFDALTDNPKKLRLSEEKLMKRCDLIFAQGKAIADKCAAHNRNVHVFPFGVNTQVFEEYKRAPDAGSELGDLESIRRPIIGYMGGIHKHVDIPLIEHMAKKHPEWSIVLVGPNQIGASALDSMPNVIALGKKDFEKLPAYIEQFDVCTIPYVISDYTKTVYPTKLNEYHIMGKPVVSTALPEVMAANAKSDVTAIANDRDEFVALVERALTSRDEKATRARVDSARKNGWSERIEKMSLLMHEAIERKRREPAAQWQERFLLLYKNSRRTAVKAVAAAVVAYLLVFHTSLVWILAQPLAIADEPRKADAIVVLGGGVGESGKVGQGYEERVAFAAGLYKEGYARRIVFSSGYTFILKETLVMQALAESLGVPRDAIILETNASNTYEHVRLIGKMAERNGWRDILLLSSPYHMRRVSLTFHKDAPGLHVVYTPVPNGTFYAHGGGGLFGHAISVQQITGIAHEYIGIAYYWLKGWI